MFYCLKVNVYSTAFPSGSDGKESACSAGDPGSIPGSGRSFGEKNGYPFQYPCLENSMDLAGYSPKGRKDVLVSRTTERLTLLLVFKALGS